MRAWSHILAVWTISLMAHGTALAVYISPCEANCSRLGINLDGWPLSVSKVVPRFVAFKPCITAEDVPKQPALMDDIYKGASGGAVIFVGKCTRRRILLRDLLYVTITNGLKVEQADRRNIVGNPELFSGVTVVVVFLFDKQGFANLKTPRYAFYNEHFPLGSFMHDNNMTWYQAARITDRALKKSLGIVGRDPNLILLAWVLFFVCIHRKYKNK